MESTTPRSAPTPSHRTRSLAKTWIFAGGSYPLWSLLAPAGALDPTWIWWALGGAYIAAGLGALRSRGPRTPRWFFLPAFAVASHQHALLALNPGETFYAVAAVMAVLTSIPLLEDRALILAYSALVVASSIALAVRGGGNEVFLFSGVVWVLLLANRFVAAQANDRAAAASQLHVAQTELAHERSERERLQEELLVGQRMDSLGRLAGAFSHEFNNQLMAIRIHAELLESSLPPGAPQREDLARIQVTTIAAADLTARLLAFSRPSRTDEEPADLGAAVRQNVVTLRHLMSEKSPVAWSVPESGCRVPVGAKQLSQILLNLALNARDAMPLGGALRIEVTRLPRAAVELPIDIPCKTLAVLTVSDTGTGIAPEVRERIFEPFFTTKGDRGNSGLGLSVVYGIVKESGGHVRVTSERGKGTRFDLYWPEQAAAVAKAGALAPAIAEREPYRARVLLVEDQAVLRDGLARWLGERGFAVVACESGEEALARANGVDVIASDVVLRGMDGIELLGRLRRNAPQLPAVLFSGHLDHLAAQRREIPSGVMFLEKPFAPEVLVTTIDNLVESARNESRAALH